MNDPAEPLANEAHEGFCIAYAALERLDPGQRGNASKAYLTVKPNASKKTAENQCGNLLKRPEVSARVEHLLSEGGLGDLVRSNAYIDDLAMRAAESAKRNDDGAVMLRAAEMLDRGRRGGPLWVKETRSRRVGDSPFTGKTPEQIASMKKGAAQALGIPPELLDPEAIKAFIAWKSAPQIEAEANSESDEPGDGAGARDSGGEPVH